MQPERMTSGPPLGPAGGRLPTGARYPMPPAQPFPVAGVLLIALLVGVLIGVSLALLSLFLPGVLPPLSIN